MADEKKNGRISIRDAIAVVAVVAALGGSWWAWGQQTGELKQRVQTVEERQKEDRRETKQNIQEIKNDVKDTKNEVVQIRILLETMKRERSSR